MKLHYTTLGEGDPLIILHGLFGSGDNWQTLARRFAETHQVFLVDQRNHGHSPHSDAFSYELMAADLAEFIEDHDLENVTILGHSMGGKTAMVHACNFDQDVVKLIIVDMAPKSYPVHHRDILDGLLSADLKAIASRGGVDKHLQSYEPNAAVRQFLLKNLYWIEKGVLAWRFNVPVINREIQAMVDQPVSGQSNIPALFIRGGQSNYILENDEDLIKKFFPFASIFSIEKAGHWVHAEAPETFYDICRTYLNAP